MIKSLFGKAKAAPPPSERIKEMREVLDQLQKREQYLEKKAEAEMEIIKKNAGKNRRVALMALKRKKQYDAQIDKLGAARMNIESIIFAVESATTNFAALNAVRTGAQTLQQISRHMDIDKVEDIMEEVQEQMDLANEIADAISRPIGETFDEDELNAELDELERQELEGKFTEELPELGLAAPATRVAAPAATASASVGVSASEEDAFRELEMGMS